MMFPFSHLYRQLWHSTWLRTTLKPTRPSRKEQTGLLTTSLIYLTLWLITITSSLMALSTNKYSTVQSESPVSTMLANLEMEYVEERALNNTPHPLKWWYRYVDDSHVCIAHEHVAEFRSLLNPINQHINGRRRKRRIYRISGHQD